MAGRIIRMNQSTCVDGTSAMYVGQDNLLKLLVDGCDYSTTYRSWREIVDLQTLATL
ncbi:hypothetical protein GCM10023184_28130 [Flaviaesturariibacter amylovorans]|uniref:Uncharacterized protein n=1 Tax=Flaviaesturariibacter amylovorans TaxID=1084520 RepID=A0ABP8H549_9BACT